MQNALQLAFTQGVFFAAQQHILSHTQLSTALAESHVAAAQALFNDDEFLQAIALINQGNDMNRVYNGNKSAQEIFDAGIAHITQSYGEAIREIRGLQLSLFALSRSPELSEEQQQTFLQQARNIEAIANKLVAQQQQAQAHAYGYIGDSARSRQSLGRAFDGYLQSIVAGEALQQGQLYNAPPTLQAFLSLGEPRPFSETDPNHPLAGILGNERVAQPDSATLRQISNALNQIEQDERNAAINYLFEYA